MSIYVAIIYTCAVGGVLGGGLGLFGNHTNSRVMRNCANVICLLSLGSAVVTSLVWIWSNVK